MSASFERTLRNDLCDLSEAAREVRAQLARAGVEEEVAYSVDLALEELVGNTIRYGYPDGGEHRIRIELCIRSADVRLEIEDDARPFDPTAHPEAQPPASLEGAPPGGRGIRMVRRMITDMRYEHGPRGNTLALVVPRRRA